MAAIDDDFAGMLADCHAEFGDTIKIRRVSPAGVNTTKMRRTVNTEEFSVSAIREEQPSADMNGRPIIAKRYGVRHSDLEFIPKQGDELLDGDADDGAIWRRLASVDRSVNGQAYTLTVHVAQTTG